MKFYDIIYADSGFDLSMFYKYRYKGSVESGYLIIRFDQSDINEIVNLYHSSFKLIKTHSELLNNLNFLGSDGFIYILTEESLISSNKLGIFRYFYNLMIYKSKIKKSKSAIKRTVNYDNKFSDSVIINKKSYSKFNSFEFYSKKYNVNFNFRLKTSKSLNQPLVIYMAGGGCHGYDNIKPIYEYYNHIHKQLKNFDCSVLIPQSPSSSNFIAPTIYDYIGAVSELIYSISSQIDVDNSRLYLVGTSYGGWCTWNMINNNPNLFACGIPVMGTLLGGVNDSEINFENFRSTPLWVAHSSDDDNVSIKSDDYCVEELKKLGIDVKYTRWDKYGHKMCNRFYRNELWSDWMFNQKRQ